MNTQHKIWYDKGWNKKHNYYFTFFQIKSLCWPIKWIFIFLNKIYSYNHEWLTMKKVYVCQVLLLLNAKPPHIILFPQKEKFLFPQ